FMEVINPTYCKQIITLGDIQHFETTGADARRGVEDILSNGNPALTIFHTAMIIGEGSTALEMFAVLTSKTPIVIAQNWTKTHLQPIAINDVLEYLEACLMNKDTYHRKFDIGGPEVLLFKQMLLVYIALYKDFKPSVVTMPFLNTQLSSHLLNLLSTVSYPDAQTLVENLKCNTVCRDNSIKNIIPHKCLTFKKTLQSISNLPINA
ncbi:MAG: DUF2867 domain-containing protein, partial [Mucilaginibacter sp.]